MSEPERKPGIDWGVVLVLALVLAVPLLGWQLYRMIEGQPPAIEEIDTPEMRRLQRELAQAERELEEARKEARMDTQPETFATWRATIQQHEAEVEACKQRILEYARSR